MCSRGSQPSCIAWRVIEKAPVMIDWLAMIVDHYRRLLDDTPGDTARLAATAAHYPNFSRRLRSDLCGRGQLVTDALHARAYSRFRQVRQSRICLRYRRLGDDADDLGTPVHRHARDLG